MERRRFIRNTTAASLAVSMPVYPGFFSGQPEQRFGVAEAGYYMRWYRDLPSATYPPFSDALDMLNHCHEVGFGGIQVGVRGWDKAFATKVSKRAATLNMFLEGQIGLPKTDAEVPRFEAEVKAAKVANIDVLRAACLSGRRYETFDTREAFEGFRENSVRALQRAEPLLAKHSMKLAVENHKDWRIEEMLSLLRSLDSEWIGVTLDTGNNIALLENPMEVVRSLAPFAFAVHLKDMGVAEYEDGFLLAEVNLGTGYLPMEEMIAVIRSHRPNIRFNLEMITRDPLKIPCLTAQYWATFDQVSAPELAVYLREIRQSKAKHPLPIVSNRPTEAQLVAEVENNRACLQHARQHYGFI